MEKYRTCLLVGAPGSGKGTQGKTLGMLPGFFHCACGDVFRSIDTSTPLGQSFLKYSSRGQLVPDEITVQLWRARIKDSVESHAFRPQFDRLVLDGIPRNLEQAQLLEDILEVEQVFHLVCPDQDRLVERLKKRALRDNRLDDANEDVIRSRLEVYRQESEPLLAYYPPERVQWIDALAAPHRVMHQLLDSIIGHSSASESQESDTDQERLLFNFLMENTPDRIYFKDTDSRYLKASRAIAHLFNLEDSEAVTGQKDSDFFPEEDALRMVGDEQRIMKSGEPIRDKVGSQNLPGGGVAWTLTTKMPLRDENGQIIGTCGISKDITKIHELEEALAHERDLLRDANEQLKAAQAQVVKSEKAASVARLAFSVTHEIKSPLAFIGRGLERLSTQGEGSSDPAIQEMRNALRRAEKIVSELMLLSTAP